MSKQNTIEWLEKVLKSGLTYEQEQLFQSAFEQAKEMEEQRKNSTKVYNRKAVFTELADFDPLAGPHDYIEVCEWHNGEGFDVEVSSNPGSRFQLTWGQWDALNKLMTKLLHDHE